MRRLFAAVLCTTLAFTSGLAIAQDPEQEQYVRDAQEKLKATFQNLTVNDFKESPVKGLFEMNIGHRIVYFHPEAEVLIFGEIFSKDGRSLTQESQALTSAEMASDIPTELAVVVGPEDGIPIIEFTDPDCPYCHEYHNYVTGVGQPVKRIIFFVTTLHPSARPKAIHVLCAKDEDKEAAFLEIYSNPGMTEFNTCENGEELLNAHATISRGAGVDATPYLFLGRAPQRGFRRDAIAQYIAEQARLLASN